MDHNSHLLWDARDEAMAPQNHADWHNLGHAAMIVAAPGPLILIGGSGPNDDEWVQQTSWTTYTDDLTVAALAALDAVQARDLDALVAARQPTAGFVPRLPQPVQSGNHRRRGIDFPSSSELLCSRMNEMNG